jgi:hypothetical protein
MLMLLGYRLPAGRVPWLYMGSRGAASLHQPLNYKPVLFDQISASKARFSPSFPFLFPHLHVFLQVEFYSFAKSV